MGHHSAPTLSERSGGAATAVAIGAGLLAPLVAPGVAEAAPASTWDKIAHCESGNNWAEPNAPFYGGLQFTQATWQKAGGTRYAARADLATRAQQIEIADAWLARVAREVGLYQAWATQWPDCSRTEGTRAVAPGGVSPAPAPAPALRNVPETAPVVKMAASTVRLIKHRVVAGDTLSKLALRYGECLPSENIRTCWMDAYTRNKAVIGPNPNAILPGQVLAFEAVTPGSVTVHQPATKMGSIYVVEAGDTFSEIGAEFGINGYALYLANKGTPGVGPTWNDLAAGTRIKLVGVQQTSGRHADHGPQHAAPFELPVSSVHIGPHGGYGDNRGDHIHRGVDLGGARGAPLYAVADCTVVEAGPASGFGLWGICRTVVAGVTFDLVYGHMDTLSGVKKGDHFRAGDHMFNMGENGTATAPHLHFEVWAGGRYNGHPIDPVGWLRARGLSI
jgi:LysM repeat protein